MSRKQQEGFFLAENPPKARFGKQKMQEKKKNPSRDCKSLLSGQWSLVAI